jgi:YjbE family integral membrane protein
MLTEHLAALWTFFQVVLIDISLSGDNAIIIAMAAAGLPPYERKRAIALGIGAAILMRIIFALTTVWLLDVPGLVLIGGLMLAWVCWKMWRELRAHPDYGKEDVNQEPKTLWEAVMQITIADVSMSLDNVLAVAGAAHDHLWVMTAGLVLAIAMMAVAANVITGLLQRWPWLNYAGLAMIVYVSARMIVDGFYAIKPAMLRVINLS